MGCSAEKWLSSKFVKMIRCFHDGMNARVNFDGELSESFPVENGVKQEDLSAPTLFAIYFAAMLQIAFRDNPCGIYIRYRSTGNVFHLSRLRTNTKVFYALIRDLLYAHDADLVSHTEKYLQSLFLCFDTTADTFGLTLNQKKTVVMYQPSPAKTYHPTNIHVKGKALEVVDKFVYLGGMLTQSGSLDLEISSRVQKAASSFGKLEKKV